MAGSGVMRVLVADDEPSIRALLERLLANAGHDATIVADGTEALDALGSASFDLILTDVNMPGATGLEVLAAARERQPDADVVVMTAVGTIEGAVEAMQLGARDFLTKPVGLEHVQLVLERTTREQRRRAEHLRSDRLAELGQGERPMLGDSPAMQQVRDLVRSVAQSDTTVLITGDSGSGKELVARAVHAASDRAKGPFVPINCAALNPTLLESEIFGHEKGAFTGADARKLGLIEAAGGGTLFMDEIGETEPAFQAKLLRVLEEREFFRVGGTQSIRADARILAATNRDLPREVESQRFREDLYYRLNVFPIHVPPLRDRLEDIPTLAEHLLEGLARRLGRERLVLAPEAVRALQGHRWPGNVRELRNALERAALLCAGSSIACEHLPAEIAGGSTASGSALHRLVHLPIREARAKFEQSYLRELLRSTGGNVAEAARQSGMGRSAFHEMLKRLDLDPDQFRA